MITISLFYYCKNVFIRVHRVYEYIDDWEKFNEKSLPEKEDFYSQLNIEDINDAD